MTKTILGRVLISANAEKNHVKRVGGKDVWIDAIFNPRSAENVTQDGVIHACHEEQDVKNGDHVYGHHFMCDEDNKIRVGVEDLYSFPYTELYCVVEEDGIRMLDGWNLIEPIEEAEENYKTESGIYTKSTVDIIRLTGVARWLSPKSRGYGVKSGDTVYFTRIADYEMIVEGKTYYRVRDVDLLAKKE